MNKLLLSAAILTAFVANAKAMHEGKEDCPDVHSLRFAMGDVEGGLVGKEFEFKDEKGTTWHAKNIKNPHGKPLENLTTGANPVFTHSAPGMCHVSFDKRINTPAGEETGVSTILTLDLVKE